MALLAPLAAFAEPALESASIRFFEQADGPVLAFARRLYTSRFDATRMRMLGVEIAATHTPPAEAATISLACTLRKPDGTEVRSERAVELQLFAGQSQSYGASLLWRPAADAPWQPGLYEVGCVTGASPAGRAQFEVAVNPAEVADGDIRVAALRIFPVEEQLPPRPLRSYVQSLVGDETRRIGVELEFSHAPLDRTAKFPVDCWFFWPDGQTSPPLVLSYEPQPSWAGGYSAGAMGWEQAGNWQKGVYTVTCAMHGQPVYVDRFDVT